jgi:SSS family solute:Na+ symporter
MGFQLTLLVLYSVGIVVLGFWLSRRVRGAGDFLVAGRSLGPGLILTTFLAANIGAGSTVGATGIGYQIGLSAWWWVGSAGIGSLILANTVGPRIWRIARDHDLHTLGDFLDMRYNRNVRGLIAALIWLGTLAILAGQLIAISRILRIVVGLPDWQGALAGGVVVMAYFAAGGLWTAARVNVVQLGVMLAGFLLALPFALGASGGWTALNETLDATRGPEYTALTGAGPATILGYLVILVPSFIVSPGLIQKLYGGRDARAVRVGINLNALALLLFAFVPAILGMVAFSHFPGLEDAELALPRVMVELIPQWIGLLALAAIVSAELSTCDAILFMLSTSLGVDLYKRFLNPHASEERLLMVSRLAAVGGGCLGILIALALPSIIAALTVFYGLLAVALFVPTIFGLYWSKPGAGTAVETILLSVLVTVVVYLVTGGAGVGILTPYAIGILAALAWMLARTALGRTGAPST